MEKDDKKKGFHFLGKGKGDVDRTPCDTGTEEEKRAMKMSSDTTPLKSSNGVKPESVANAAEEPNRNHEPSKMKEEGITNHISADLTEQDKKEIYDAIDVIRRKLSFAKDFSDEERRSLMRLGKTGREFVEKAQALVEAAPGILPRSFDVDEFHRDAELYHQLGQISDELRKLTDRVSDTEAAVGSDAFTASLVVYQSGKLARTGDDMDNLLSGWRRKVSDGLKD